MRKPFCETMLLRAAAHEFFFLTGDLGFMALEPIREALGSRFINCGVAEQNMIGVASGLAREGHEVWVYSIAPFCYARPFEQIRNDVCFHALPVFLVGNGGGYGYGVMGPTHHALEDYGVLLALPNLSVFVPAFDQDIAPMIDRMGHGAAPCYLRLGLDEMKGRIAPPTYAAWRRLQEGSGVVVIACGPVVANVIEASTALEEGRNPEVWLIGQLPLRAQELPTALQHSLNSGRAVLVVEEHTANGGVGAALAHLLLSRGMRVGKFGHLCAQGYPSGRYGSQAFHRRESGLDPASIREAIAELGK